MDTHPYSLTMSTTAKTNGDDTPSTKTSACVLLETSMGDLVIDLDCEGSPRLVQNFIKLCKARYYTQNLIHTVVLPGRFLVTGDATGTGTGGASIYALLEYYKNNNNSNNDKDREVHLRKSVHRFLKSTGQRRLSREECKEKGRVVALELNGVADTVGSQFLITTASGENKALDGYSFATSQEDNNDDLLQESTSYLSLGRVVEDESNILDRMATTMYCDDNGRPYADVRIHRALIVHDPFEDPPGMADLLKHQGVVVVAPNTSTEHQTDSTKPSLDEVLRSPSPERPEQEEVQVRIPMEQVLEEMNQAAGADGTNAYDDPERERARMEELARQADRSRAVVLEMLGDLPSADITAPENVLFVCKLNAITTDGDLELIFSRFDPNVKVEIVRDHDTGQSLQYAFCEFTTKEQAAQAYFKMDNALVDDRRIKVDFSQSVAKMWDRYNQRIRQPAAAAVRQGGGSGGRGGGRAGGGKLDWQPPPRQQQQQQQHRRGPPQNTGRRPPEQYHNQTGNAGRQHFSRDNQNSQRSRVEGGGRDNVAIDRRREDRPPESWRDNPDSRGFQRRSSVPSRDEGSHRRSREDNSNEGDRRHQRHGSRDRVEERRERGNGESRHKHGGGGRNVADVVRRDRDNNSRDSRDKYCPEHRHRDERRSGRRGGGEEEEDSVESRERKKDRRSRDDEKLKDRQSSRRDERKRVHDDDHSNDESSRSERRSKRKHERDDRSSDDDNDSSRHRKKKHKHEKRRHKDRGHRHKHRHRGHESQSNRRDHGNFSNEEDRHPRKRDSHRDDAADDHSDDNKDRNHTRDDRRQRSREERSHDHHDDPDARERERRHRTSPPEDGDGKDEESRERHRDRKHHSCNSKSSHSNKK